MKPPSFAALALLSFSAAALCQPQFRKPKGPLPQTLPTVVVKNFDIFVDSPTGFVFVKLPQGWKFVGEVDEAALASLPPTVITALPPDERDGYVAGATNAVANHR